MYNIFWGRDDKANMIKAAERLLGQYFRSQQPVEALALYTGLLGRYPDVVFSPTVQVRMGALLAEDKQFRPSALAYKNFAVKYPEHPQAVRSLLATAQILTNNLKEPQNAVSILTHILNVYPDTPLRTDVERLLEHAQQQANVGFV